MKIFGSWSELVSLVLRRTSSPLNTVTIQPGTNTANAGNVTISLPPKTTGASTLADTDTAQTLTNKSIDADANTVTNIENADIKAGAAIARTKLASGTASHVIINDGSGVMTSEAQLAGT